MSSINIAGDTSGSVILTVPAAAGSSTITLPAGTGTVAVQGVSTNIVQGTAQASTSGTAIDFTGIPSWVKRITVMFSGVSSNGTSAFQLQLGSGSFVTTGYVSSSSYVGSGSGMTTSTTGLLVTFGNAAANTYRGAVIVNNFSSNTWVSFGNLGRDDGYQQVSGGSISLSGTLDRVRITTLNGTDVFDAGSVNIMYE